MNKLGLSEKLTEFLRHEQSNGNIVSFSFYGSYMSLNTLDDELDVDIDFMIIFSELNKESLSIIDAVKSEAEKYLGNNFFIVSGYYYGAYKPIPKPNKKTVFLHANAHTIYSLAERHTFFKWGVSVFMDAIKAKECKLDSLTRPKINDFLAVTPGTPRFLRQVICEDNITLKFRQAPYYHLEEIALSNAYQLKEFYIFSMKISVINFLFTQGHDLKSYTESYIVDLKSINKELPELINEIGFLNDISIYHNKYLNFLKLKKSTIKWLDKIINVAKLCQD